MLDRKNLSVGMTTSIVTTLIYLDQNQCGLTVVLLSILVPFFAALKK
ncbi:hypothetical protein [Enterococcus ratti]|uniref:Uncharacterized protein n=1 Tax=Enterococcus ratti TaxID=150033 RepID=A0A1L8WR82_9ENTE|nr:hypothetical protein [Enterococcus ratti]OJG83550.1 hypothetical protein RV14_GL001428 [Enterococcus ratti]